MEIVLLFVQNKDFEVNNLENESEGLNK